MTTTADRVAYQRARYLARREGILERLMAQRESDRLDAIEHAVLLGRPIGRTLPACGTKRALAQHRRHDETCTQCAFIVATDHLARTWRDPREVAAKQAAEKEAARLRQAARYQADREVILARNKAWADAHPEQRRAIALKHATKPDVAARRRTWQEEHADRVVASRRRHYEKVGRVAHNAMGAAWRAANPDRARAISAAAKAVRRSRERHAEREIIDRQVVWQRDGGMCHICSAPADPSDWHLDHVTPLARGGAHLYSNVRVSHPFCNRSKGVKVA